MPKLTLAARNPCEQKLKINTTDPKSFLALPAELASITLQYNNPNPSCGAAAASVAVPLADCFSADSLSMDYL